MRILAARKITNVSCIDEPLNPGTWRAAGIRPYGLACTIQRTLNKERTAVGPLQSALRAASFPREGSFGGSGSWCHLTGCHQNRQVEGRQVSWWGICKAPSSVLPGWALVVFFCRVLRGGGIMYPRLLCGRLGIRRGGGAFARCFR